MSNKEIRNIPQAPRRIAMPPIKPPAVNPTRPKK